MTRPLLIHRQSLWHIIALCAFILFTASCNRIFDNTPFSHVADSYAQPQDSLKRAAAEYLGHYADYHYGRARYLVDAKGLRIPKMNPLAFATDTLYRTYLDSLG